MLIFEPPPLHTHTHTHLMGRPGQEIPLKLTDDVSKVSRVRASKRAPYHADSQTLQSLAIQVIASPCNANILQTSMSSPKMIRS